MVDDQANIHAIKIISPDATCKASSIILGIEMLDNSSSQVLRISTTASGQARDPRRKGYNQVDMAK